MTKSASQFRIAYMIWAIAVFLAAMASLWLTIFTIEGLSNPKDAVPIERMTVTMTGESQSNPAVLRANRYRFEDNGKFQAVFTANIAQPLSTFETPSLLGYQAERVMTVELDGFPLSESNNHGGSSLFKPFEPQLFTVPSRIVEQGKIDITVMAPHKRPVLRVIYIGEFDELSAVYRWRNFFGVQLITIATGIAFMSALVALAMAFAGRDRRLLLSFGAIMLSWSLVNLSYIGPTSFLPPLLDQTLYSLLTFLMIVASVSFVNEWTFKNIFVRNIIIPTMGVILTVLATLNLLADPDIYQIMLKAADCVAVIGVVIMLSQVFWAMATGTNMHRFESFVFLFCILAVMTDVLTYAVPGFGRALWPASDTTLHYGPNVVFILGLTIIGSFAREALALQNILKRSNADLSEQLAAREAEIKDAYAERETQMRDAALMEERKRIMRDMHDGVGGRLLSLSLRAKNKQLGGDKLSEELDESLQELRLIVDSMDTADGDLDIALGALRGRIEPMLHDAGIELVWDAQDLGEHPEYGPREVLSIYRMVQESVSNAVRHSGATTLTFTSRRVANGDLQIELLDNGRGIGRDTVLGKGLANIHTRAEALGGRANIANANNGGLCVRIDLPRKPSELTGITP